MRCDLESKEETFLGAFDLTHDMWLAGGQMKRGGETALHLSSFLYFFTACCALQVQSFLEKWHR
jgi:hypothetical protein